MFLWWFLFEWCVDYMNSRLWMQNFLFESSDFPNKYDNSKSRVSDKFTV